DEVDVGGKRLRAQATPAAGEHRTLARALDGLEHEPGGLLGVADDHAAEADIDGGRSSFEKTNQGLGGRPRVVAVEKPVAGDLVVVGPVRGAGDDRRAEAID